MVELIAPSEALSGAFVLPAAIDAEAEIQTHAGPGAMPSIAYAVVVGNLGLLLPSGTVSTILEDALPMCRLPNTPHWLRGMASYNGTVLAIFDLAALLAFASAEHAADKTLIIGQGEDAIGVSVAAAPIRVRLDSAEPLSSRLPLPAVLQPYVRACYKQERVWVDWDVEGFFTAAGARV